MTDLLVQLVVNLDAVGGAGLNSVDDILKDVTQSALLPAKWHNSARLKFVDKCEGPFGRGEDGVEGREELCGVLCLNGYWGRDRFGSIGCRV
jgi:hypothetical protein